MPMKLQKHVIIRQRGFMSKKKTAQSIIEYGLIMVMVAVISVLVLNKFGITINLVGRRSTAEVSTDNSMQTYCNAMPAAKRAECRVNIH